MLNARNLTVIDIGKAIGRSKQHTFELLHNPYKLTFRQLLSIAGCLGVPDMELYALIRSNRAELVKEDKATLAGIVEKVEREERERIKKEQGK